MHFHVAQAIATQAEPLGEGLLIFSTTTGVHTHTTACTTAIYIVYSRLDSPYRTTPSGSGGHRFSSSLHTCLPGLLYLAAARRGRMRAATCLNEYLNQPRRPIDARIIRDATLGARTIEASGTGCHACGVQSRPSALHPHLRGGSRPLAGLGLRLAPRCLAHEIVGGFKRARRAHSMAAGSGCCARPTDSLSVCPTPAVFAFICTNLGGMRFVQATSQVRNRMGLRWVVQCHLERVTLPAWFGCK